MSLSKNNASTKESNYHDSVLFNEVLKGLNIKSGGIYVDATLGRCGHTQGILNHLDSLGRVIGFDQDIDAIKYAEINFSDPQLELIHSNFSNLNDELNKINLIGKVDGVLMDLGISSPQIDNADRGFSFNKDGLLDMRMDQSQRLTATEWLKETSEKEIADTLYQYGEEKRSRIIASTIKEYQKNSEIKTTLELANLISTVVKPGKNKHPATRSFQAIRIAINDELIMLSEALNQTIDALDKGGRLAVISFHSIEDRIVKQFIQKHSRPKQIPKGLPIMMNDTQPCLLKDLGKVKPSNEEIKINRRSRSAILRIAEKC
ncbi:16S rRNA (cytosine(1402)-N(4))-methyltransferase RsmH [Candidatus Pseudothioglobus singularis]|uniref:Ribosomal RNA small subunit methyltransferase H n=1 Tax=Candidatus Pseudothioglobus singularis PS1 TaxID=1125411 RepID=A0A0M3T1S4_9GAMM|nr:16S rRNA (cytosine(1402)-N(4))-methyltransferase RsmH [Candidatus Pseudothioglobus singularis]ALE01515.1 16S rRNA methyltransferase [Candidatus Pseudothioglobus singularis PS1]